MKRKNIFNAIVVIAIALAFIMPGAVAFANVEQTMNENISSEIGNIVDLPTLDDDSDIETPEPLTCLLYTSPSPRDRTRSRMPSSA